jgi:probable HAF family extracellular repeat protein
MTNRRVGLIILTVLAVPALSLPELSSGSADVPPQISAPGTTTPALVAPPRPGAPRFDIALLKPLAGWADTRASAVNDRGQVAGDAWDAGTGEERAMRWVDGKPQLLLLPREYRESSALGIGENGEVVGNILWAPPYDVLHGPAVWSGGHVVLLDKLFGEDSQMVGVNSSGQAAGWGGRNFRSFVYHKGRVTYLDLGPAICALATSLNNRNQVAGFAFLESGPQRPVVWENGQLRELPALASWAGTGWGGRAASINQKGDVAGYMGDNTHWEASLWRGGERINLGSFDRMHCFPTSVNDADQVVGIARKPAPPGEVDTDADARAFLWQDGRMSDLNTLIDPGSGWVLEEANSINNRGQIAGTGHYQGKQRGFLLTPR